MKSVVLIWAGVLVSVLAVWWVLTTDMIGTRNCGLVRASDGVCLDGRYEFKSTGVPLQDLKPCIDGTACEVIK